MPVQAFTRDDVPERALLNRYLTTPEVQEAVASNADLQDNLGWNDLPSGERLFFVRDPAMGLWKRL